MPAAVSCYTALHLHAEIAEIHLILSSLYPVSCARCTLKKKSNPASDTFAYTVGTTCPLLS